MPYLTYLGTRPPTLDEWNKYEFHHRASLSKIVTLIFFAMCDIM